MQPIIANRTTNLLLFLVLILLFSLVSMVAANAAFMVTDNIYYGVSVGDISVGGLSTVEAEQKITAVFKNKTSSPVIRLRHGDQRWDIAAEEIDLRIDAHLLAKQAYEVGRRNNIFSQLQERYLAINHGHQIPLSVSYDSAKLLTMLNEVSEKINRDAANAYLLQQGKNYSLIPEVTGQELDIDHVSKEIAKNLISQLSFTLDLTVKDIEPSVTASDLQHINGVIASFTTQFDPDDKNRSQNIILAAKSINKVLVRNGDSFSFNKYVGPRLAENGYKEAPVFVEGKLIPDWGGGVCQVSSTLYNAVLLANMAIEERTSHFRPPGYVPLGQDATVADNLLDFTFKNSTGNNIYIVSEVYDGQLSIHVLGQQSPNKPEIHIVATDKKTLEPNTIIKQDPSLDLGKQVIEAEGQRGFTVSTYRIMRFNGHEIRREHLASDEFKPVDHVIRIGTKVSVPGSAK